MTTSSAGGAKAVGKTASLVSFEDTTGVSTGQGDSLTAGGDLTITASTYHNAEADGTSNAGGVDAEEDVTALINPIVEYSGDTLPDPSQLATNTTTSAVIGPGTAIVAGGTDSIEALNSYYLSAHGSDELKDLFSGSDVRGTDRANDIASTTVEIKPSASVAGSTIRAEALDTDDYAESIGQVDNSSVHADMYSDNKVYAPQYDHVQLDTSASLTAPTVDLEAYAPIVTTNVHSDAETSFTGSVYAYVNTYSVPFSQVDTATGSAIHTESLTVYSKTTIPDDPKGGTVPQQNHDSKYDTVAQGTAGYYEATYTHAVGVKDAALTISASRTRSRSTRSSSTRRWTPGTSAGSACTSTPAARSSTPRAWSTTRPPRPSSSRASCPT